MKALKILLIDNETKTRKLLASLLDYQGYAVTEAASGQQGLELFQSRKFDIVITNFSMPELGGLEVAEKVKAQSPTTPVVLLSNDSLSSKRPPRHIDLLVQKGLSEQTQKLERYLLELSRRQA